MAVITEDAIRELATIKGEKAPITSCYLDVDGRRLARRQDLEHEVDLLLRDARVKANGVVSVQSDLRRIGQLVRRGIDRSRTRGLAIFACSASDLWEVIELSVKVHSQVVINHVPALGQLEAVLREHEPVGVLLADRQRARLFVFHLGELVEHSELFDALPRDEGNRGERDRNGDHPHHVEALTHQHLRNAAQAAFQVFQQYPFEHLVIAASDPLAKTLEADLHPYLRERLAGRASIPVTAGHDEVWMAAAAVEARVERAREAALVDKLRAAVESGRRGVKGLAATLDALGERRVDRLLVSKGYTAPGWRCDACDRMAVVGRWCKHCHREMVEVENVVEEAVEDALGQSCQVEICHANADLDVMGRIGALLRY